MRRPRRLSPAERHLWRAYPSGEWVDLRSGDPETDNPANGAAWGHDREVRSEVIAALLLGAADQQPGQVPGIRLAGARISGRLNLSDATIDSKLHLLNCYIPDLVDLTDSKTHGVRLRGCDLERLRAARATIDGLFELDGSVVRAGLRLDNAHVLGQFRLSMAEVRAPQARPVATESPYLDVRQPYGTVDFEERGATQQEWAVWAGGLVVDGGAFMRGLRTRGGLRLIGAKFHGGLYLQRAEIIATGPYAINADFMEAGAAELGRGFVAEGTIRMRGARITGVLSFHRATLRGSKAGTNSTPTPTATNDSTPVGAGTGNDPTPTPHTPRAANEPANAEAGGKGGIARAEPGDEPAPTRALDAVGDAPSVDGDADAQAVDAVGDAQVVDGGAGAEVAEEVQVGGDGAGRSRVARESTLHLSHMQVNELILRPAKIEGGVNLGFSQISVLLDGVDAYPDWVRINGLTYESMRGDWTVAERINWLSRDPEGYRPQPYEHLAAWYRRIGHEPDARRVLLAKQRERRTTLRGPSRGWGRLLDLMVGYGYRSWLAGVWAVLLLAAGTTVFWNNPPTQVDPDEVRTFQPFVYTLDLLAPVSVFEARAAWEPVGWTQWVAWTLIVSGWVLATALIAGVTRVLRPAPGS